MRVLGIDPGYGRCGMAIVERVGTKDRLVVSDCIETSADDDFVLRLSTIIGACTQLIETHEPDAVSIEKLYFSANQKTAMRVAEARGALIECATEHGVDVFEYTPAQIKSATTGSGRADKKQIIAMLHLLIAIDKKVQRDDEYDAIAAALTHFSYTRPALRVG